MQSLASLMSSAPSDIAPLDDLDGDDEGIYARDLKSRYSSLHYTLWCVKLI